MRVPDSTANLNVYTKHRCNNGGSGYPLIRVVALLCCGTRTIIDTVFGPTSTAEITYTHHLLTALRADMIVLLDRNFAAADLITAMTATGAHVLVRIKSGRRMPVLARYRDGSYLSTLGVTRVRVIDAEITITTAAGHHTGGYRLAITLLQAHHHPAFDLSQARNCLRVKTRGCGNRGGDRPRMAGINIDMY